MSRGGRYDWAEWRWLEVFSSLNQIGDELNTRASFYSTTAFHSTGVTLAEVNRLFNTLPHRHREAVRGAGGGDTFCPSRRPTSGPSSTRVSSACLTPNSYSLHRQEKHYRTEQWLRNQVTEIWLCFSPLQLLEKTPQKQFIRAFNGPLSLFLQETRF